MSISMSISISISMSMSMYTCMHIYAHVCMYICIYVYMYICICMCIFAANPLAVDLEGRCNEHKGAGDENSHRQCRQGLRFQDPSTRVFRRVGGRVDGIRQQREGRHLQGGGAQRRRRQGIDPLPRDGEVVWLEEHAGDHGRREQEGDSGEEICAVTPPQDVQACLHGC